MHTICRVNCPVFNNWGSGGKPMKKLSLIALAVGATTLLAGCNPDSVGKSIEKHIDKEAKRLN